jgi:hypothetical protein
MNPQLSHMIAQSRQQELIQAAQQSHARHDRSERTRFSRRLRWTHRTPKSAPALSPQVRVV